MQEVLSDVLWIISQTDGLFVAIALGAVAFQLRKLRKG